MMDIKSLSSFDWKALNAYLSPRAMGDLNVFLEKLPYHAGQTVLITAGIAWAFAAGLGLITMVKAQDLNNLRAQLQDAKALKPIVPVIAETPIPQADIDPVVKNLTNAYPELTFRVNGNEVQVTAGQTSAFSSFREAVMQIQGGGQGWKTNLEKVCVGRECKDKPLSISVKITKISVNKPDVESVSYLPADVAKRKPKVQAE